MSWPALVRHVDTVDPPGLSRYDALASELADAYTPASVERIREINWTHGTSFIWYRDAGEMHRHLATWYASSSRTVDTALADARSLVARMSGFGDWAALAQSGRARLRRDHGRGSDAACGAAAPVEALRRPLPPRDACRGGRFRPARARPILRVTARDPARAQAVPAYTGGGPPMHLSSLLGFLVVPAIGFAAIYFPALTHFTLALVSPYPKADIARRMNAAFVDVSLAVTAVLAYQRLDSLWMLAAGAGYLLFRDSLGGRSIGKALCGLVVVDIATGKPATFRESIKRNLIFVLPGANLTAIVLEALTIQRDPQGCRLGDRIAHTQVIHGLGAREAAAAFFEWWSDVVLQASPGRRRRKAATIDRAG